MGGLASGIGDLFGGAQNNAGFTATSANLTSPVTGQQVQQGYDASTEALRQQQALANAFAAQNGIQNQSNVFNQLQGVANGTGPNPALAQLNQSTGTNVANQAALMAGQRGASANPALLARQIAQQGAATQQQGAGQAATLESNQQLNALNSLGGLATQQVGQQQQAVSGLNTNAQGEQNQLLNSLQGYNSANVSNQGNLNSTNQAMSGINANNTTKAIGGLLGGIGSGGFGFAQGGEVENPKLQDVSRTGYAGILYPSHMKDIGMLYHGNNFKSGGGVPGKAEVKGDSKKNDTVPAMLSPGEFVIPKSVMESEDPAAGAAKMIAQYQSKNGKGDGKQMEGEFKSALQRAIKERKSK